MKGHAVVGPHGPWHSAQADSSGTTTYTYDTLNRLTGAAYPGTYGTWGWTYDPVGNRTLQSAPNGTVV